VVIGGGGGKEPWLEGRRGEVCPEKIYLFIRGEQRKKEGEKTVKMGRTAETKQKKL